MRVHSSVPVAVEQAQSISPGSFRFDTSVAKAVGGIGDVLVELGEREEKLQDIESRTKADTARKLAEDEYTAHIENNADTSTWNKALTKAKNRAISKTNSLRMSPEGRRLMNASMGAWGDEFSSAGEIVRIKQKGDDVLNEASILFQDAVESGDEIAIAESRVDLQEAAKAKFTPIEAAEFEKNLEGETLIFKDTNIAANNPTPENMKAAFDTIKKFSADAKERYVNEQRLRSMKSKNTQNKNATFKAFVNQQSQGMGTAFSGGALYQQEVVPDLEVTKSQLTERFTNGTLEMSDGGTTFDFMLNKINTGGFFDPDEITSAYATGMSSDEYEQIVRLNEENAKLTMLQKEQLSTFGIDIGERYKNLAGTVRPITTPNTAPAVFTAIGRDKKNLQTTVRDMVKEGKPEEEIYEAIESSFIKDTDRFYTRWFDVGVKEPVKDIAQREERFEAIMDLLKTGEKKDFKTLQKSLEFWYK